MSDRRFELPDELEELRLLVREITEARVEPRAAEIDETDEWPEDVYKVLVDHDLMGVGYPEEDGGSGGGSLAYVVFATSDPALRAKGISAFLVRKDDPGVSFGRAEKKMGVKGSPTREVILSNARIPVDRLIGEEGGGFAIAMRTLDYSRPVIASQAVGIAQGALDFAARYATERKQFGERVSDFEGIRFMLADMAMRLEAARTLTHRGPAACAPGDPRMTFHSSVAKGV